MRLSQFTLQNFQLQPSGIEFFLFFNFDCENELKEKFPKKKFSTTIEIKKRGKACISSTWGLEWVHYVFHKQQQDIIRLFPLITNKPENV